MKKIYSLFLLIIASVSLSATTYTVNISGFTYSPATLTVSVGDVITISASSSHPLVQVDQTNWNSGTATPMSGGWGTKSSTYTFTVTTVGTIYYGCQFHIGMGMKGQIDVVSATGIEEHATVLSNVNIFPNPAKNKFSVKYNSSENVSVSAKLYSICGQEVETLVSNKEFTAGSNTINVELQKNIPAGVYFIQLNAGSAKIVRKIIID